MAKGRVEREKRVIKLMIELYCHKKHQHKSHGLCDECQELLTYAHKRLSFVSLEMKRQLVRNVQFIVIKKT